MALDERDYMDEHRKNGAVYNPRQFRARNKDSKFESNGKGLTFSVFVCLVLAFLVTAASKSLPQQIPMPTAAQFVQLDTQALASAGNGTNMEVGFSPGGSSEALVLKCLNSARTSIRLAAYSFTAAPVVRALLDAKKRGVDVAVAVDLKNNVTQDSSGKARAALNALVNAGIATHVVSAFPMQHSKYAVIDGLHVQTGSYNYSAQAARYNSENVLVIWGRPDLAQPYLDNWQRVFNAGQPYSTMQ